jgi:hypothetical protein
MCVSGADIGMSLSVATSLVDILVFSQKGIGAVGDGD